MPVYMNYRCAFALTIKSTMKAGHRVPSEEIVAIRLPGELAREVRRLARQDDRTVSGFLRRLLAATLRPEAVPPAEESSNG
jgi:hypothetical protein